VLNLPRSLFTVFWLQAVILWFVALPLLAAARGPAPAGVTATDVAGILLIAVRVVAASAPGGLAVMPGSRLVAR
jgi:steroid 5-alpha reductase family enzyme